MANTLQSGTAKKALKLGKDGNATWALDTGKYIEIAGIREYYFTTAITTNVTATTAPVGSFAKTSHATGRGKIFTSNGSVWLDTNV